MIDAADAEEQLVVQPYIGTEVTGHRRFPRPDLDAEIDQQIVGANGAMLFGLRRIGKSSEAATCCERLKAQGWTVIKEDAQGKTSEAELLLAIMRQLPNTGLGGRLTKLFLAEDTITQTLRDSLSKFTGRKEDVEAYFGSIAAVVERAIVGSERLVIVIDEFAWLCRNILVGDATRGRERVDLLLAALRRWRNQGVRMLLLGSIGMVALGRRHGLDLNHLNDLQAVHIPPLTPAEAKRLCDALVRGGAIDGWTPEHTDALLAETGALYPVMIQKGFQVLTKRRQAAALTAIPDLFATKVRPDLDLAYYAQFDQRMRLYDELPDPLPRMLPRLLDAVFGRARASSRDELHAAATAPPDESAADADVGDALQILREDGFLEMRAERDGSQNWSMGSELVRLWRKQRRGTQRP